MSLLRTKDIEVWEWYQIYVKFNNSKLSPTEFCKKFNVDHDKFSSKKIRFEHKKYQDPDFYEKIIPVARRYLDNGCIDINRFAKKIDVPIAQLGTAATHLKYLDTVEKFIQEDYLINEDISELVEKLAPAKKNKKENQPMKQDPMNFIQVPLQSPPVPVSTTPLIAIREEPIQQEFVKKQNDLELIITKGVKVIVSPEIGTEKLIKIIEFLKDL